MTFLAAKSRKKDILRRNLCWIPLQRWRINHPSLSLSPLFLPFNLLNYLPFSLPLLFFPPIRVGRGWGKTSDVRRKKRKLKFSENDGFSDLSLFLRCKWSVTKVSAHFTFPSFLSFLGIIFSSSNLFKVFPAAVFSHKAEPRRRKLTGQRVKTKQKGKKAFFRETGVRAEFLCRNNFLLLEWMLESESRKKQKTWNSLLPNLDRSGRPFSPFLF